MSQTITPYLLYEDGEAAIEFLTDAFGFRLVERTIGGAGGLHAELELDGGNVYLGEPPPGFRNPSAVGRTSLVFALVSDVAAHFDRAKGAGAEIIEDLHDADSGHRRYGCVDPQGHEWYFATALESEASASR